MDMFLYLYVPCVDFLIQDVWFLWKLRLLSSYLYFFMSKSWQFNIGTGEGQYKCLIKSDITMILIEMITAHYENISILIVEV